jgi:hypothetical protein
MSNSLLEKNARLANLIAMGIDLAENHEFFGSDILNFPEEIGVSEDSCRSRMKISQPALQDEVLKVTKIFEQELVDFPLLKDAVLTCLEDMFHYRIFWYLIDFDLETMSTEYFDILRFREVPFEIAEPTSLDCDKQCEEFEKSPRLEILKTKVLEHLSKALELEKR